MCCSRSYSPKDLKKLWGRSAGRCAQCHKKVLPLIDNKVDVIADMAHVIAYKQGGARGEADSEYDNSYENLILLCPDCHRIVDHNPQVFTTERLFAIKNDWETMVDNALNNQCKTLSEALQKISALLEENHNIWLQYGPESKCARNNPSSNMADYWTIRKLDTIVPNNRMIVNLGSTFLCQMPNDLRSLLCKFNEHAKMFEQACYSPLDVQMRFPKDFGRAVRKYAKQ